MKCENAALIKPFKDLDGFLNLRHPIHAFRDRPNMGSVNNISP